MLHNTRRPQTQRGFTFIELMIVVTLIGILAVLGLPAYRDYSVRAKVSELMLAASACRVAITEVFSSHGGGSLPNAGDWGCEFESASGLSRYVASVQTAGQSGQIIVTARGIPQLIAPNDRITLTPMLTAGTVSGWTCGGTIPQRYRPGSCRG